jgi:hypothetical protein
LTWKGNRYFFQLFGVGRLAINTREISQIWLQVGEESRNFLVSLLYIYIGNYGTFYPQIFLDFIFFQFKKIGKNVGEKLERAPT